MWRHLRNFHPDIAEEESAILEEKNVEKERIAEEKRKQEDFVFKPQSLMTDLFKKAGPKYKETHPNQKKFHQNLKSLLVLNALPFKLAGSSGFRKLVHDLDPKVRVGSRMKYSRSVRKEGKIVKRRTKEHVKNNVVSGYAATADGWTSRGQDQYLGINAHFIDSSWRWQRITTTCRLFNVQHSGENIKRLLTSEANSLDLSPEITRVNVTDTAPDMLSGRQVGGFCSFSCANHKLQLAVHDGDEADEKLKKAVQSAKDLVTHAHHSGPFHKTLKKFCKRTRRTNPSHSFTKLFQDVKTRWNSTYDMIDRCLDHQSCLQDMELHGAAPRMPTIEVGDWRVLRLIHEILAPFKRVTKIWESETEPTMSTVGEEIFNLKSELEVIVDREEYEANEGGADSIAVKYARSLTSAVDRRFPKLGMDSDLPAWGNLLNPWLKVTQSCVSQRVSYYHCAMVVGLLKVGS